MTLLKKKNEKYQELDIEDVIGSFGPFQKNTAIILFIVSVIGSWHSFSVTFQAPNVEFHCVSENYTHSVPNNQSQFEERSFIKYRNGTGTDRCHVAIWPEESGMVGTDISKSTEVLPCTKWEYDSSVYPDNIVSEWDLVCEREWLISLAKSMYMFGFMAAMFVCGQLSDWVGRYPTMVMCYVIMLSATLMSVFSRNYLMFVILRFFQAFGGTGLKTTGFILLMEIIGIEKRTLMGIVIQVGGIVGAVTFTAVAFFIRPWMWLQLAVALPVVPLACICCIVSESPRWLRAQGKMSKLKKVLRKACKQNKLDSESDISNMISGDIKGHEKIGTIFDLLRTPQMRKRITCMGFLWSVTAFVYYSLVYNTNDLSGDPYLNFFLSFVVEFPSHLSAYFAVRTIGRRLALIISMLGTGAAYASLAFVPPGITWLVVPVALVGQFFVSGAFAILYLYTTELFPTVVRNTAFGSCSTCARVGAVLAPFTRDIAKQTHYTVPNALNAILAITSALIATLLPETMDKKIPDTLEEGEVMGSEKFGTWSSSGYTLLSGK